VIVSDELNHASLIDGCRLSRARVVVAAHGDLAAIERSLRDAGGARRRFVVTESLFSMDGDLADLAALASLCARHDAALIVDEAHAIGARGPEGRGAAAAAGVVPDVLVGTFGKALGGFGAFAATSPVVAQLLYNRARTFVFSTALPPAVAAANLAAVEIVRGAEGDDRRRRLAANACRLRAGVPALRGHRDGAIAPLAVGGDREVMALSSRLLERGVFAQGIRPPTVPEGTARLRVSVSSGHEVMHLDRAVGALREAAAHG
jgi:7-keto-8-aminopelargonate synthetase-like enzyme